MTESLFRNVQFSLTIAASLAGLACGGRQASAAGPAAVDLRHATNIDTGLAVVVGGDIDLPADLAADGRIIVDWLLADAHRVDVERRNILRRGLGGRVLVNAMPKGRRLPHPDRFVNLLVADLDVLRDDAPVQEERMRVLATRVSPEGISFSSDAAVTGSKSDCGFSAATSDGPSIATAIRRIPVIDNLSRFMVHSFGGKCRHGTILPHRSHYLLAERTTKSTRESPRRPG